VEVVTIAKKTKPWNKRVYTKEELDEFMLEDLDD